MSYRKRRTAVPAIRVAAPLVLAAAAFIVLLQYWPGAKPAPASAEAPYSLQITMIDVGQGDSILLSSGGQYALVDAGENDSGDDVVSYLTAIGVKKLSAVVGTHPHSDHIGGLDTVLEALPVDSLYLSPRTGETETYEDVLDAAGKKDLFVTVPKPGDTIRLGDAELTFLWPPAGYGSKDENDCSLVLMARAGGRNALLCGDIGKDAEQALLDGNVNLDCDVLKVAHHGSDSSSSKALLDAASPQIALISVGTHNDYNHPDKDVLGRLINAGARYYRTDMAGNIVVSFTDNGIAVATDY